MSLVYRMDINMFFNVCQLVTKCVVRVLYTEISIYGWQCLFMELFWTVMSNTAYSNTTHFSFLKSFPLCLPVMS